MTATYTLSRLRITKLVCFALIFGGLLSVSNAGYADSLITTAQIGMSPNLQACTGSTSGAITCTVTGTDISSIGMGFASAVGSLAGGTMGTSVSLTNFQDPVGTNTASADASTHLSYNFAMPTNLNGDTVLFSLGVLGASLQSCGGTGACIEVQALTQLSLAGNTAENFVGLGSGSEGVNLPSGETGLEVSTLISNGSANLDLLLSSQVFCFVSTSNICSGSSDFIDPLSITGAQVLDSSGVAVSGISIVSDSGFNPNASAIATSEPSSLLLLGFGLLALIGIAKGKAVNARFSRLSY